MKESNEQMMSDLAGDPKNQVKTAKKMNKRVDREFHLSRDGMLKERYRGGSNPGEKISNKHLSKQMNLCETLPSKIMKRCKRKLNENRRKCENLLYYKYYIPWFVTTYICHLINSNIDCNLVRDSAVKHLRCDSKGTNVGQTANDVENVAATMFDKSSVSMAFKSFEKKADETAQRKKRNEANRNIQFFKDSTAKFKAEIIVFVKTVLLILMFAHCLNEGAEYVRNYVSDDSYDNKYIGPLCRRLDKVRKAKGKPVVLPLKQIEKQTFISDIFSSKLTPMEKEDVSNHVGTHLLLLGVLTLVFITDFFVYQLSLSQTLQGEIVYHQTIDDYFKIKVVGDGVFARALNTLVEPMNIDRQTYREIHTGQC